MELEFVEGLMNERRCVASTMKQHRPRGERERERERDGVGVDNSSVSVFEAFDFVSIENCERMEWTQK